MYRRSGGNRPRTSKSLISISSCFWILVYEKVKKLSFAQPAYEWFVGSRKKAFDLCEKALYCMCIGELRNIDVSISVDIEGSMPYEQWRPKVIEILIQLRSISIPVSEWTASLKTIIENTLPLIDLSMRDNNTIGEIEK